MKTTRKFYALRELPMKQGDHHPAFQIEVVELEKNKVVGSWMYGKPDTKQMCISLMSEFADPTNLDKLEDTNETSLSA